MGSSNPWPPYKDCSLGICSIYCPKFCYVIFPPPPPSNNNNNSEDSSSTSTFLSPLVIAVIGILASAFLLVTYYLVVTRYCHRRSSSRVDGVVVVAQESAAGGGVEERVIKAIGVYKYKKGEGLVEGTDCSVCLTEFEEDDTLRVMPKCTHAFHLPCIDTWLNSHSTCPLCRSSVLEFPPAAPHVTVTAHASTHQVDTLFIICDSSSASIIPHDRQAVVDSDTVPTSPKHQPPNTDPPMRRSASAATGACSSTCEPVGQDLQLAMAVGTTHPFLKRSISCDRFTSARCERKLIYPV